VGNGEASVLHSKWAEDPAIEHVTERGVFNARDKQPEATTFNELVVELWRRYAKETPE